MTLTELKRLYYATGIQDCDNAFDGNDVPSADDLREGWEYSHADSLETDERPHAETLREEWVRGWLECAAIIAAKEAARDAARRAEEAEYE